MSARQLAVLEALGIVPLVPRSRPAPAAPPEADDAGWDRLAETVRDYLRCIQRADA